MFSHMMMALSRHHKELHYIQSTKWPEAILFLYIIASTNLAYDSVFAGIGPPFLLAMKPRNEICIENAQKRTKSNYSALERTVSNHSAQKRTRR